MAATWESEWDDEEWLKRQSAATLRTIYIAEPPAGVDKSAIKEKIKEMMTAEMKASAAKNFADASAIDMLSYAQIADGDTTASLYRRDENYNFTRVGASFTDVPEDFWAYDEISWASENGYMNGTSDTTFSPNGSVSRQQIWMILARLAGAAPADMAAARAWAVENEISDGSNPGGAVTRQQLAALLYRFAQLEGYDTTAGGMALREYPDYASVADYAEEALSWAVGAGVITGTTQGTLNPGGTATRAQFAVMLSRFWSNV